MKRSLLGVSVALSHLMLASCSHAVREAEPVARMDLHVTAPDGEPRGLAVLTAIRPIRAYCDRRTCLRPLLSGWMEVRFSAANGGGDVLLALRTTQETPHPAEVRDFLPEDQLRLDFEVARGGQFYLRRADGEEISRLPANVYAVSACLRVKTWPEIEDLELTDMNVCSEGVRLEVE